MIIIFAGFLIHLNFNNIIQLVRHKKNLAIKRDLSRRMYNIKKCHSTIRLRRGRKIAKRTIEMYVEIMEFKGY